MPRQSKLATSQINQLVSSAITAGAFPLTIIRPEDEKSCNPISLFERKPRFVWAPEAKVGKFCWQCNKKLNGAAGYQAREVQDIEHSTDLYFARYKCSNCCIWFSTTSEEYIERLPLDVQDAFPYILTHKSGNPNKVVLLLIIH